MTIENLKKKQTIITKTWKYLGFTLRKYGKEFLSNLGNLYCITATITDHKLEKATGKKYSSHIFMVFDKDYKKGKWESSIEFFRNCEDAYEIDYPLYHPNLNLHVIVFKVPKEYKNSIEFLKKSKYSKMFNKKQIREMFTNNELNYSYVKVLRKHPSYRLEFEEKVNNLSNDDHEDTWIEIPKDAELDFKFNLSNEVLNYDESLMELSLP